MKAKTMKANDGNTNAKTMKANNSNSNNGNGNDAPVVVTLDSLKSEMLRGDSQILTPIGEILKANGISIPAMIGARNSANAKRDLVKLETTNKTKDGWRDKGAEYRLGSGEGVTPAESRVKDFYAWQTATLKMAGQFGMPDSWSPPQVMLATLKACFPFVKKAEKPAAAPTPTPTTSV